MLVVKIGGSIAEDASHVLTELATRSAASTSPGNNGSAPGEHEPAESNDPTRAPQPIESTEGAHGTDRPDSSRQEALLVHGFGPQTTQTAEQAGITQRWLVSPDGVRSRFTDEAMVEVMREAADQLGASLATRLQTQGCLVEHIRGYEGVIEAEAKPALRHQREDGRTVLVRGNRSGRIASVDVSPIEHALASQRMPLLTPLARDEQGLVSVDADRAAAAIAAASNARELVLLTDVPRVLDEEGHPLETLDVATIEELISAGTAEGGMMRKLLAAREAIEAGVPRVLIADGTRTEPIARALAGEATEVIA